MLPLFRVWLVFFVLCVVMVWEAQGSLPEAPDSDVMVATELNSITANTSSIPEKTLSKFLLGLTETGVAHALHTPEGHDFTGASAREICSTTLGLKGTELMAGAVVDAIEHYSLEVTPLTANSWMLEVVPFSKASMAALLLVVTYNVHTKSYDFFKQTHRDRIALHTGNAGLGLTYEAVKSVITGVTQRHFGVSRENSALLAESATVVLSGVIIGLLAKAANLDIPAKKFNSLSVLLTALAIGHTVARTGKSISYSIQYLSMSYGYSESTSQKIGTGVQFISALAGVTLFTTLRSRNDGWGKSNYAGKITGDIAKNTGALVLIYGIKPFVQQAQIEGYYLLDSVESAVMSSDMKEVVHPYVCKTINIGGMFFALSLASTVTAKLKSTRVNDVLFGGWLALGGVQGLLEMSWVDHLAVFVYTMVVWPKVLKVLVIGVMNKARAKVKAD